MAEQNNPTPEPQSTDRFDYGDTEFRPGIDSINEPPPPPKPTPERDQTGKFLPKNRPTNPTPEGTATDASAPTAPKHPTVLVRRATEMGFSQRQIDAMSTEDLDQEVFEAITRENRELRQERQARDREDRERRAPQPMDNMHADAHPVRGKNDLGIDPDIFADLDPTIQKTFTAMHEKLKNLDAGFQTIAQREQQRENESQAQKIDRNFAQLNMPHIFGDGGIMDLNQRRENRAIDRRKAFLRQVAAEQNSSPNDSFEACFSRVADLFYPQGAAANTRVSYEDDVDAERPNGHPSIRAWQNGGVQRPDNRTSHDEIPPGVEKATRTVARMQRERGQSDSDTDMRQFPSKREAK